MAYWPTTAGELGREVAAQMETDDATRDRFFATVARRVRRL